MTAKKSDITSIETLLSAVNTAKAAYEAAQAKVDAATDALELGSYHTLGGVPYMVSQRESGQKFLRCMISRNAQALLRGETPPTAKKKAKKTAPDENA